MFPLEEAWLRSLDLLRPPVVSGPVYLKIRELDSSIELQRNKLFRASSAPRGRLLVLASVINKIRRGCSLSDSSQSTLLASIDQVASNRVVEKT